MSAPNFSSAPDGIPRFEVQPVSQELQDAVNQFWLMRLDTPAPHLVPRTFGNRMLVVLGADGLLDHNAPDFPTGYRHQLVVPDGSLDILVRLPYKSGKDAPELPDGGTAYACVLMPVRHTVNIAFRIPSFIFIIRFFPGGARDFFPASINTLGDRAIPLSELWETTAVEFADAMAGANSMAAMAEVAEKYLLARRREPSEASMIARRSVQALEKSQGNLSLDELQRESGITERQLERLFKEYVGISPKRLSRTLRLNYLMEAIRNLDGIDWHDLIVTLNYCDQPHLIREFRDFVGMSPASFRKEMKRHVERKQRIASQASSDSDVQGGSHSPDTEVQR